MAINRRETLAGIGAGGVALSALGALSGCSGAVNAGLKGPLKGGRTTGTLVRLGDAEIRTFDPHIFTELASARVAADQFVGEHAGHIVKRELSFFIPYLALEDDLEQHVSEFFEMMLHVL